MIRNSKLFVFFFMIFLSGYVNQTGKNQEKIPREIIIFIHGAISTSWKAPLIYFFQFINDDISGTTYEKIASNIRKDDFFHQNQAIKELGLVHLNIKEVKKGHAAAGLGLLFDTILQELQPKNIIRRYYTYGWKGHFTKKAREKDAANFYEVLFNEYKKLIDEGFDPTFKIIGYCHGAQMITELGKVHEKSLKNNPDINFTLDEIILLAMPVSPDTATLLSSSLFKKIYHIFSTKDRIQKIDIFVTKTFIGSREIAITNSELAKKLVQIELKVKKYLRQNKEKINFNQTKHLVGHTRHWKNISPGHIELWFFGWTPDNYRNQLAFYPLPGLIFIPPILHFIQQEEDFFDPCRKIVADIRPDFETIILRQHTSKKKWRFKIKPLFNDKKINMQFLQQLAHSFAPHTAHTISEYKKRIAAHYK